MRLVAWIRSGCRGRVPIEYILFIGMVVMGFIVGGRVIGRAMMGKYRDGGEMLGHGRIYEPGQTVVSAKLPGGGPNPGGDVGGGDAGGDVGNGGDVGGGDVGGTTPTDPCSECTQWDGKECSVDGCIKQTRTCKNPDCKVTSQCVGNCTPPDPCAKCSWQPGECTAQQCIQETLSCPPESTCTKPKTQCVTACTPANPDPEKERSPEVQACEKAKKENPQKAWSKECTKLCKEERVKYVDALYGKCCESVSNLSNTFPCEGRNAAMPPAQPVCATGGGQGRCAQVAACQNWSGGDWKKTCRAVCEDELDARTDLKWQKCCKTGPVLKGVCGTPAGMPKGPVHAGSSAESCRNNGWPYGC